MYLQSQHFVKIKYLDRLFFLWVYSLVVLCTYVDRYVCYKLMHGGILGKNLECRFMCPFLIGLIMTIAISDQQEFPQETIFLFFVFLVC